MSRRPAIARQGTSACRSRNSGGRLLTASPMTWRLRRTASNRMASANTSSRSRPSVKLMTLAQLASMSSRKRTTSRDTDRVSLDVRPDAAAEAGLGHEIDLCFEEILEKDPELHE